ncbi:unnamed protein product [Rotaria magnacalcarata]|uniref:Uncharacterized protein n=3 Tax=Rotaria magnacalcarata TaxID=392030 RepID=A0A816WSN2_9BILA|nr:unnamed protein product [Rotaria magnacalcarata]CAF3825910.1 unnamed protein product [Rotaria magnacalcarata]
MGNKTVTPAAPVTSAAVVPHESASVKTPVNAATRIKSPNHPIPSESSTAVVPIPSKTFDITTTNIFAIKNPNSGIPVISSKPTVLVVSPKPTVSIVSPKPTVLVVSPKPTIPTISPTPSTNETFDKSSNLNLTVSPDVSTVFPTVNTPTTPPADSIFINLVNSTTPPGSIHSGARIANNGSIIRKSPVVSQAPIPTEVIPKRTVSLSRASRNPSTLTVGNSKSINLSSANRGNKFESEKQSKEKSFSSRTQQVPKPNRFVSKWTESDIDERQKSALKHIIPVPSYTLRATAVCKPVEDNLLLERSQSIHADISLFKFYLDQKETQSFTGNHTKATMFQMDTLLKRTPFPKPSISFYIKNFNDGAEETDINSTAPPTFRSLGLENDLDLDQPHVLSTRTHSNEKREQEALRTPSISDVNSNNNKAFRLPPSSISNQPNLPSLDSTRMQNNHQQATSILKKRSNQTYQESVSAQNYMNVPQNLSKTDFEKYRAAVSFNLSPLSGSEHLQSKQSFYRKN